MCRNRNLGDYLHPELDLLESIHTASKIIRRTKMSVLKIIFLSQGSSSIGGLANIKKNSFDSFQAIRITLSTLFTSDDDGS